MTRRFAPMDPTRIFAPCQSRRWSPRCKKAGAPAEISNSAGTFVCNHLIYGVLHHLASRGSATRAGFIHVPYLESQVMDKADTPAMSLASMITGAKAAIMAAIKHKSDLKLPGGARTQGDCAKAQNS